MWWKRLQCFALELDKSRKGHLCKKSLRFFGNCPSKKCWIDLKLQIQDVENSSRVSLLSKQIYIIFFRRWANDHVLFRSKDVALLYQDLLRTQRIIHAIQTIWKLKKIPTSYWQHIRKESKFPFFIGLEKVLTGEKLAEIFNLLSLSCM